MLAKALTIAGSDSGGGAGIQADLKTFAALGVYGMSAITAITAQNTCGVSAVQGIDPEVVAAQIRAVVTDIGVGAAKTGMLFSAEIIQAVATTVRALGLQLLVVDPVMVATSGDRLLQREAEESLRQNILPLATVVTPNLAETEVLVGRKVASLEDMQAAQQSIAVQQTQQQQAASAPPPDVLYNNALRDYQAGKNDLAVQEFSDYVKYYPNTDLAGNANFPDGNKAAAAELKKGLSLIELGQQEAGIASLRHVIQRYPKSNEALQARDRLRKLGVGTTGTTARREQ